MITITIGAEVKSKKLKWTAKHTTDPYYPYICMHNNKQYEAITLCDLARLLMIDNVEDQEWIAVDTKQQTILSGPSIEWLSKKKLVERMDGSSYIDFKPMSEETKLQLKRSRK